MLRSSVFWSHYLPATSCWCSKYFTHLTQQHHLPLGSLPLSCLSSLCFHGRHRNTTAALILCLIGLPCSPAPGCRLLPSACTRQLAHCGDTHAKTGTLLSGSEWGVVGPAPLQALQSLPSFSILLCGFTGNWLDGLCSVVINALTESNLGKKGAYSAHTSRLYFITERKSNRLSKWLVI